MGFSMRLAPGVRVRVSGRGVRASIGPRALRLHVGSGRPGISTGVGPFSAYTSLAPRSSPTRSSRYTTGQVLREVGAPGTRLTAQEKAEAAAEIRGIVAAILDLHRATFTPNTHLLAPPLPPPDPHAILTRHKQEELRGLSWFARAERKAAVARATDLAAQEIARTEQSNREQQAAQQRYLDEQWQLLVSNEPRMVLDTLAQAFADNDATAVPVGVDGGTVSIAVLVPDESSLPDRTPSVTAAGNLSLRQTTGAQRNSLYVEVVAGYILVTIKEALAVCPGLVAAKVVAFRALPPDAYGHARAEVVAATTIARQHLDGIQWDASASQILNDASSELYLNQNSRTFALQALDPASYPGIDELLNCLDLGELLE